MRFVTLTTNRKMKLDKASHVSLPFLILKTPETYIFFLICVALTRTSAAKQGVGIFFFFNALYFKSYFTGWKGGREGVLIYK